MSAKMGAPLSYADSDNIVAQTRKTLGLSQQELARRIGVTSGAISQFENGKRAISRPVELLCKLLLKDPAALDDL